jgi:misacylated tRNA(Ala) deacylase
MPCTVNTELVFRADAYLQTASARVVAVHEHAIELDRTIFYPTGGGQVGDSGALLRANGERIAVVDTRKGEARDSVLHILAPATPRPAIGEALTLELDWPRRHALMRLHTALHVMSCVVVAPVTGATSLPRRRDSVPTSTWPPRRRIEREQLIIARRRSETVWISDEEPDPDSSSSRR